MIQRHAVPSAHFTIAHAGASRAWAAWIGDQLALQGHGTTLVRWPPGHEVTPGDAVAQLLEAPGPLVLILDDWIFTSAGQSAEEWTEALRRVVPPNQDRVACFNVAMQALPVAAAALQPVDLLNIGAEEARRRITRHVGLAEESATSLDSSGEPGRHRFPNDPPSVWNVPRRNGRFTGREVMLDQLHTRFFEWGPGTARIALQGMPGVGKSQLADEYAHRYGNEYELVWYVSASSRATARKQLAELANRLGLPTGQELGEQIRTVREALSSTRPHRRWLIVLDGAEDPDDLSGLLPEGDGHVLITTRSAGWADYGSDVFPVTVFTRAESIAFVQRRAPRLLGYEAEMLAEEVEDLPLLLDQTSAWLQRNVTADFREYLRDLRRGDPKVQPGDDYPRAISAIWAITLNSLYEDNPAFTDLLNLCAFFSPDTIPIWLLRMARRGDLPDHLAALVGEPSSWNNALRRLSEASAVRIEYEERPHQQDIVPVRTVRMHRLYHGFVRRNMPDEERAAGSATACRVLATADPGEPSDPLNWGRYDSLIPHLEPAGALESNDPEVRGLVLNCIEYLRNRGEHVTGLNLCSQVVTNWRPQLGPTDRSLLIVEHQHANMLRRLGRYHEAESTGRRIVEQLTDTPGTAPIDLLRAKDGLAGTLMALGSYDKSVALFTEEVRTAQTLLGEDNVPRTLSARTNLGTAKALQGDYRAALDLHQGVLIARRKLHGERHQLTLNSALQVAWTLRLLGRYGDASSLQELNARIHGQILDKRHAQTLHAEHNYALCLRRNGELDYAEALMRSVVNRSWKRMGAHHPGALMVSADYAMLLRQRGDLPKARELAGRTAALYEELLGGNHPYTVGARGNCGLLHREMGDEKTALRMAREAFHGMSAAVGEDHPWTLGCALNLVGAQDLRNPTASVQLARDTLARAGTVLGDSHPLTLNCRASLAQQLRPEGDDAEADALERAVVRQAAESLGEEHAYTAALRARVRPYWDFEPQPI